MGREIRMVPPNWEHPKDERGNYISMYDEDFESAVADWKKEYCQWENGEHPDHEEDCEFWEWYGDPPDRESYRPKFTEEPTWFQMYETVSEGTPVSPPFAAKEELVDYLVENGDFWDQSRGHGGWNRKNAEGFVSRGFAMSGIMAIQKGKVDIKMPRDQ
jgi:hypothetical protein